MYDSIVYSINKAKLLCGIRKIIPSGTAIQNGRTSFLGDSFNRDGTHLELTYGRYTVACTWFEFLTGIPVIGNNFSSGLNTKIKRIAQDAAHNAVVNPYLVTNLSGL